MSKTLTFEIADEVHDALQGTAARTGRPFEELVLEWLFKYRPKPRLALSEQEREAAMNRLRRHMGAQNLGHATGADNESIDRDLTREYGSTHEES